MLKSIRKQNNVGFCSFPSREVIAVHWNDLKISPRYWAGRLDAEYQSFRSKLPILVQAKEIYVTLECASANKNLVSYAKSRVFFADEAAAIAAGYRPCAKCMADRYENWKAIGRSFG